jgi:L,D-transpeptidase YnhG
VAIQPDADGLAEARLIDIYKLIGKGNLREAFSQAERLATDLPHFQLAQLVYGDLLAARIRPLRQMGDVPDAMAKAADNTLNELREESQRRVRALRERPPAVCTCLKTAVPGWS